MAKHNDDLRAGHNRLTTLAADIRAAHADIQANAQAMAERALAAGQWLIEAKATLQHGQWEAWLAEHVGMSARTARRYMQMVHAGMKSATVADLGIRGASEAIAQRSDKRREASSPIKERDWMAEMEEIKRTTTGMPKEVFQAAGDNLIADYLLLHLGARSSRENFARLVDIISRIPESRSLAGALHSKLVQHRPGL